MRGLEGIAERKRELVERSEGHRRELTRVYYGWQARTLAARQTAGILKNPLVLAGLGLVVMKLPWRKAYKLSGWAWKGWRLLRLARRFLR